MTNLAPKAAAESKPYPKMIASLTLLGVILTLGIPTALLLVPFTALTGNPIPLYRASIWIVRTAYALAGIRAVSEGQERVPAKTACIFMSNHLSNLDPPVLLPQIPGRTAAFFKKSLLKIPVLGYAMRLAGFVPVSRDGSVQGAQESVAAARKVLESGVHITTFVEGTRSKDGRMLPFKKGPFYLAMQTGAPCIPVSLWGTEGMMAKGSMRVIPGTAHIVFHEPVYPANFATREELMEAVRAAVASGLPEWMRG
ncbi:MAG: lysophospholipid acyltransferase family protein [Terracidiphilus sp.]|jgi:1-acyl-sn-glycerol-3-phosphate acyltransferase